MFELLQKLRGTALGCPPTIRLNGHQHDGLTRMQQPHPMQDQHRACLVTLLQPLCHGGEPALAQTGVVLQLQRLKNLAMKCDRAHTADKYRHRCRIAAPSHQLLPRIKRCRTNFNLNAIHPSTSSERRQKCQLITGLQRLIQLDQLLVNGNSDALE